MALKVAAKHTRETYPGGKKKRNIPTKHTPQNVRSVASEYVDTPIIEQYWAQRALPSLFHSAGALNFAHSKTALKELNRKMAAGAKATLNLHLVKVKEKEKGKARPAAKGRTKAKDTSKVAKASRKSPDSSGLGTSLMDQGDITGAMQPSEQSSIMICPMNNTSNWMD